MLLVKTKISTNLYSDTFAVKSAVVLYSAPQQQEATTKIDTQNSEHQTGKKLPISKNL